MRMKRREEDPYGIGLDSHLSEWSRDLRRVFIYISFSLSVLLIPSSRNTFADRSTFILFF